MLAGSKLLLFVRGNHEMRGVFARDLLEYLPTPEGRYYYARDLRMMVCGLDGTVVETLIIKARS